MDDRLRITSLEGVWFLSVSGAGEKTGCMCMSQWFEFSKMKSLIFVSLGDIFFFLTLGQFRVEDLQRLNPLLYYVLQKVVLWELKGIIPQKMMLD